MNMNVVHYISSSVFEFMERLILLIIIKLNCILIKRAVFLLEFLFIGFYTSVYS